MTVIVGLIDSGRVWLAADRIRTVGSGRHPCSQPKVWKTKDSFGNIWVWGSTGASSLQQITQYMIPEFEGNVREHKDVTGFIFKNFLPKLYAQLKELGQITKPDPKEGDLSGGTLMIGVLGKIYFLAGFSVSETSRPYHAIGLGAEPAFGALTAIERHKISLSPKKRIQSAILSAQAWTPVIGGGMDIVHT